MFNKFNIPIHLILVIVSAISISLQLITYYLYANESEYAVLPESSDWVTFLLLTAILISEKNKALYFYLILASLFFILFGTEMTIDFIAEDNLLSKILQAISQPLVLYLYILVSLQHPWKIMYRYQRIKHNKSLTQTD